MKTVCRLKCDDCGYDIGESADEKVDVTECPHCGSNKIIVTLVLEAKIVIYDKMCVKLKSSDKKRPTLEVQFGTEWAVGREKFVDKQRKIDRENDRYYEKISDIETEEIIHECSEPLSEHFGHGSDKHSKK